MDLGFVLYVLLRRFLMREIKYGTGPNVYEKGVYSGYSYYITEGFLNPCAYVVVPKKIGKKENPLYKMSRSDMYFLPTHGGVTYKRDDFMFDKIDREHFVIGWDYGHGMDFIYFDTQLVLEDSFFEEYNKGKHVWTGKEIREDVKRVIDALLEVEYEINGRDTKK